MARAAFTDVSDTAAWIAAYRAIETARTDALFRDPLAERLAGDRGRRFAVEVPGARAFEWMIAIRTCIIDDLVAAAVSAGADAVLNLGAGMDTRPYRLALPAGLRWIEVDQPAIVRIKDERLRDEMPSCRLERVGLDLTDAPARRRLFARVNESARRVVVLTEGVVGYLTNEDVGQLARDLRARDRVAHWIVDYASPALRKAMRRRRDVRRQFESARFRFDPPDWERFFADAGWAVASMRYTVEEGRQRGRPMPLPGWLRILTRVWRSKAEEIRTMMAFARLDAA